MESEHVSIYETVTRSIVSELEKGAVPWVKPWKSGVSPCPRNAVSQRSYRGVNILLLWSAALQRGYTNPVWLTFKQARELKGFVRKGEHGTRIIYTSTVKKAAVSEAGEEAARDLYFLKWYSVFNIEQTEGLPQHLREQAPHRPSGDDLEHVEAFVRSIGADVRHGGNDAAYNPEGDFIKLPHPTYFESTTTYYATSLHEHAHWSGHPKRLNRDLSGRFRTRSYAAEELIAELAAAFLCSALEIQGELRHAGYIQSWLELLENDKKAIFTAASAASRAADYLRQLGAHGEWIREYEEAEPVAVEGVSTVGRMSHTRR